MKSANKSEYFVDFQRTVFPHPKAEKNEDFEREVDKIELKKNHNFGP